MKKKTLSVFVTVLLAAVLIISCSNNAKEPEIFTVTFDTDGAGSIPSQSVEKGHKVTRPAVPQKDGYDFRGWYLEESVFDFDGYSVTSDIKLTAEWTAEEKKEYTVTFNSNNDTPVTSQTVREGEKVKRPTDPTKDNCVFWGWYKNVEDADTFDFDSETVSSDITLYALWMEGYKTFTVTFDSDGGSTVQPQYVVEWNTATKPSDPTKEGSYFTGWLRDEKAFDFETQITSDVTLKAGWTDVAPAKYYTVTFNSNGGSEVPSQTVKEGEKATEPKVQKEGYVFANWIKDYTIYNFDTPVTSDITLSAMWNNVSGDCTVTFKSNGEIVSTQTVKKWSTVKQPVDPESGTEGKYFAYWANGTTEFNFDKDLVSENTTLTAFWDKTPYYTVKFNTDGGSYVAYQRIESGKTAEQPYPTNEGYVNGGWIDTDDNKEFSFNTTITSDKELKVNWVYKCYVVAFDSNGGTEVSPETVKANGTAYRPKSPTHEGDIHKTFKCWTLDGTTEYDFNSAVTGNITLKALWRDYEVGDIGPAGGYIFYDCDADNNDENDGAGPDGLMSSKCGWRYLEAMKNDLTAKAWGDTTTTDFGTKYGIGEGKRNTDCLQRLPEDCFPRITRYVSGKTIDGYSDWFIPSRYELNLMYVNLHKKGLGNFRNENYWTSSEYRFESGKVSQYYACFQNFGNGKIDEHCRDAYDYIRPARQF